MLGQTSISAIRALLFLAQDQDPRPVSPRRMAQALDESPTYLAKITRQLVKAAILRADRGSKGGVRLARRPQEITLLQVVEACQGAIVGDFCRGGLPRRQQCAFHRAAVELHDAIVGVLGRWTLQDLLGRMESSAGEEDGGCLMRGVTRRPARIAFAPREGARWR
jgi:Rrf2 family protein